MFFLIQSTNFAYTQFRLALETCLGVDFFAKVLRRQTFKKKLPIEFLKTEYRYFES
jgi:hypothetical protein